MARITRLELNVGRWRSIATQPRGVVYHDTERRAISVVNQAKRNASGRPGPMVQTGRLRSSIGYRLIRRPGEVIARVYCNVDYAVYVERGTRPHVIRPRRKQALFWKGARHPVAYVNHPGNRPYPFLKPALRAARRRS